MRLCVRIVRDERGEFTALCTSLPGCMCHGDTRDQAFHRLDEAIRGYMWAVNNFVPEDLTHEIVEVQEAAPAPQV